MPISRGVCHIRNHTSISSSSYRFVRSTGLFVYLLDHTAHDIHLWSFLCRLSFSCWSSPFYVLSCAQLKMISGVMNMTIQWVAVACFDNSVVIWLTRTSLDSGRSFPAVSGHRRKKQGSSNSVIHVVSPFYLQESSTVSHEDESLFYDREGKEVTNAGMTDDDKETT